MLMRLQSTKLIAKDPRIALFAAIRPWAKIVVSSPNAAIG
jgi:hypothetical protein